MQYCEMNSGHLYSPVPRAQCTACEAVECSLEILNGIKTCNFKFNGVVEVVLTDLEEVKP